MARKGRAPEQIIAMLREAEVALAQGYARNKETERASKFLAFALELDPKHQSSL